jgi:phospholipid/cholesterol/gamma-HCH transport system permease protein
MAHEAKTAEFDSASTASKVPGIAAEARDDVFVVRMDGDWITRHGARLAKAAELVVQGGARLQDGARARLDLEAISKLDTAGAWMIARMAAALRDKGAIVEWDGALAQSALFKRIEAAGALEPEPVPPPPPIVERLLERTGRTSAAFVDDIIAGFGILGSAVRGAQLKADRSNRLSLAPLISQIDRMGVGAVPIVLLMATIIGAIIAQQGAFQLRFFGAEIYVVDLVGILVLRELGVLTTAIMVAGRTGSAITAEIGSMKMREEVDALTVMGLNPIGVLVFPRLAALVIALPLLSVIANFAALGGAALVASIYSGISFEAFASRLREAVDLSSVFSGLIKAPFMAMAIGIIAAIEGFKVKGSAESLGLSVTRSVVKSIFAVIVIDGLFAIFFASIDF